jgi:hypothetical protein
MLMLFFSKFQREFESNLIFLGPSFFWQIDGHKKKYRLTKWNVICRPKDQVGLGIEVLEIRNLCLLSKWLDKFINSEGAWQELLHNKYLYNKTLSQLTVHPHDFPFWRGLMKVKKEFFLNGVLLLSIVA